MSLGGSVVEGGDDALLVDDAHAFGRDLQGDPHVLFGDVELLGLQVGAEGTFGVDARVRHVVAHDHFLSGDFTFLRHCSILFIVLMRYFGVPLFWRKRLQKYYLFPTWQNVSSLISGFLNLFNI